MNRIIIVLSALAVVTAVAGCGEAEKKLDIPGTRQRQEPITDQGIEAAKARVQTAANFILKWARKHNDTFPAAEDSLQLKEMLKDDFGNEPGFDKCWVSHNGKALLIYSAQASGKTISSIPSARNTRLIWDPVQIQPYGVTVAYVNGRVDTVIERPVPAGG